jgi:hypothetical protein
MAAWSKDHVMAVGYFISHLGLVGKTWLKWRPGVAIRGKWRQLVGKVGEWVCDKLAPPRL